MTARAARFLGLFGRTFPYGRWTGNFGQSLVPGSRKPEQILRRKSSCRRPARHSAQSRLTAQSDAVRDSELGQQRRDVKLHSTLRNVESYGDLLVCEVLKDAVEDLSLSAADFYSRSEGPTSCQKLLGARG